MKREDVKKFPEEFRKQIERQLSKAGNNSSVSADNGKSSACDESLAAKEVPRLYPPCSIHIHSIRKRLCDPDGISGKAVIDGLVNAGVLPDDSPEYISEITYSQTKNERRDNDNNFNNRLTDN